ncbi:hypothetical protein WJX75_006429 [Coccomyxa subellipsoidea]|uniref:Secreted protein n=1 Tax=Coccomyxa subellipsoidea TaxID=248742 RepID=A0ABR2YU95_9CHLO
MAQRALLTFLLLSVALHACDGVAGARKSPPKPERSPMSKQESEVAEVARISRGGEPLPEVAQTGAQPDEPGR